MNARNIIAVYFHPGLRAWIACCGEPAGPRVEWYGTTAAAALAGLCRELAAQRHPFDPEWSPLDMVPA